MSGHILILEDDERLACLIRDYLERHDYLIDWRTRGDEAEAAIRELHPDLVILDVMLPGKSGFDICREIRPHFSGRILIMTASDDNIDEIVGLELGADDYLAKPVEPRRLLARIRALLRRNQAAEGQEDSVENTQIIVVDTAPTTHMCFDDLHIDLENRQVTLRGQALEFTTAEFDLLYLLASHAGQVLSRDDILGVLRGIDFDGIDRSIDARISRLRRKLFEDPDQPQRIKTVRGKGYLFMRESQPG